ncbi:LiaF transmembrane domain-containing protein [Ferruginibacter sp. SUN002]|uniref:LiaF transmembrane domain-containing protein n=1 Tax=Ferruginibacter sp. SUN002 TaxID=2937789 RepID=UPI003D35ADF1
MEDSSNNNKLSRSNQNRIIGGLIIIAIGVVLFADKMGVIFPKWLLTWPMLLIAIGIFKGVKSNFRNLTWVILVAIGGIFLWDNMMPDVDLKKFIVPFILIGVGLAYMFKPKHHSGWGGRNERRERCRQQWEEKRQSAFTEQWQEADPLNDDYLSVKSVFSGLKRTVLSKSFKGGKIECVFGGVELNLSQADIQGSAVLKLEEVFGGVKLIIPANWTVKNEIDGVFHGVDDERSTQTLVDPNKVLILTGSAIFAGIEIKSY